MRIKSIKLIKEGYEGIKVEHITTIEKMGTRYDVYRNDKYTHPISEALEDSTEKLKIHLLMLVRCWSESWSYMIDHDTWKIDSNVMKRDNININEVISLLSDLAITSIAYNGNQFSLSGTIKSIDNKDIQFSTGIIKPETEYRYYKEVVSLIDAVFVSTKDYIEREFVRVSTGLEDGISEMVSRNPKQYTETTVTATPFFDL